MDFQLFFVLSVFVIAASESEENSGVHSGHLLPFGDTSSGRRLHVEEVTTFPSPTSFLENYLLQSRPLLIKGVFKSSPAYQLWEDDYFRTVAEPEGSQVLVETAKKEDRRNEPFYASFKSFVSMYQADSVYMVDSVPEHLQSDVPLVFPLQCPALQKFLETNVMWMSSGGTKSVVHLDEVENINCLIRGRKELFFVNPHKFPAVPLDKSTGTFSSLDVDAVDYLKYPSMAKVEEFVLANMTAGDCLYIPYRWVHQVRSYDRNIAVNLWWDHFRTIKLDPKQCKDTTKFDPSITLSSIDWSALKENENLKDGKEENVSFSQSMLKTVEIAGSLNFQWFYSFYFEEGYSSESIFEGFPSSTSDASYGNKLMKAFFHQFDLDSDGQVTREELLSISEEKWADLSQTEVDIETWVGIVKAKQKKTEEEEEEEAVKEADASKHEL